MPLTGTTNTSANTALRYLSQNSTSASNSMAKLASGSRIVRASDDAASLAVGTKLKADVTALKQAQVNVNQASSVLQVADGGMSQISDILQRMKALSVQSSSGSVTDTERAYLNEEFSQLQSQVDDTADQTKFNGQTLLSGAFQSNVSSTGADITTAGVSVKVTGDLGGATKTYTLTYADDTTNNVGVFTIDDGAGSTHEVTIAKPTNDVIDGTIDFADAGISLNLSNFVGADGIATGTNTFTATQSGSMSFQVGTSSTESLSVSIAGLGTSDLGIGGDDISTAAGAATASDNIDTAIGSVNAARASVGATMSRLDFIGANLSTSVENLDAARSTLMDVDMAAEMSKFSSKQVMMQASVAMLAQANQMPQQLMRLLN